MCDGTGCPPAQRSALHQQRWHTATAGCRMLSIYLRLRLAALIKWHAEINTNRPASDRPLRPLANLCRPEPSRTWRGRTLNLRLRTAIDVVNHVSHTRSCNPHKRLRYVQQRDVSRGRTTITTTALVSLMSASLSCAPAATRQEPRPQQCHRPYWNQDATPHRYCAAESAKSPS